MAAAGVTALTMSVPGEFLAQRFSEGDEAGFRRGIGRALGLPSLPAMEAMLTMRP